MKALDVDFAPPAPPARALVALAAIVMLATVGVLGVGWQQKRLAEQIREAHVAKVAEAAATERQSVAERAARAKKEQPPYAADALAALRLQQFPLNAVLTALETVAVVGVRVTSVDIVTADATVRVQVEFSDYEALMKYLEELNAGEPGERWMLANAQSNSNAIGARPSATLTSRWNQAGSNEHR